MSLADLDRTYHCRLGSTSFIARLDRREHPGGRSRVVIEQVQGQGPRVIEQALRSGQHVLGPSWAWRTIVRTELEAGAVVVWSTSVIPTREGTPESSACPGCSEPVRRAWLGITQAGYVCGCGHQHTRGTL